MHGNHMIVVRLVIVNDAAVQNDLSALAVDQVIGLGHSLVEGRRIRYQLERRAGLVHIADCVIAQQRGRGVAKLVGIERGPNGERENLARVHILHHHRPVVRMGALHGMVKRALGEELDV